MWKNPKVLIFPQYLSFGLWFLFMYNQNNKKLFNKGDFVMIFQDNVLKEYLKNVYFVTGTPCGGKTTISRELANRHNLILGKTYQIQ